MGSKLYRTHNFLFVGDLGKRVTKTLLERAGPPQEVGNRVIHRISGVVGEVNRRKKGRKESEATLDDAKETNVHIPMEN